MILILITFFALPTFPAEKNTQSIYKHKAIIKLNGMFKKYIYGEYIAYERLLRNKADVATLREGLAYLSAQNPKIMSENEQKAFWLNIYNISIIDEVLKNYPVKSVMDIEGFFTEKRLVVHGEKYSFDDIEKIELKKLGDPRVHFALVCASISCPNIERELYEPNRVNWQLDNVTHNFLTNKKRNRISSAKAELSMLFKWYAEDFGGADEIRKIINSYIPLSQAISGETPIEYIEYDWRLNGEITGRAARN